MLDIRQKYLQMLRTNLLRSKPEQIEIPRRFTQIHLDGTLIILSISKHKLMPLLLTSTLVLFGPDSTIKRLTFTQKSYGNSILLLTKHGMLAELKKISKPKISHTMFGGTMQEETNGTELTSPADAKPTLLRSMLDQS